MIRPHMADEVDREPNQAEIDRIDRDRSPGMPISDDFAAA